MFCSCVKCNLDKLLKEDLGRIVMLEKIQQEEPQTHVDLMEDENNKL